MLLRLCFHFGKTMDEQNNYPLTLFKQFVIVIINFVTLEFLIIMSYLHVNLLLTTLENRKISVRRDAMMEHATWNSY